MKQLDLLEMLSGTNVALKVLSARLLLLLTLTMTFALSCWAMYLQSQMGAIIAAGFAVLVFLPVLLRGERRHADQRVHAEETSVGAAPGKPARAA